MRVVKCIMKVCALRVTCVGLRNRCRKNISARLSLLHVLRFSVKRARCLFFHQSVRWIAVDHLSTSLFLHVQAMHQDSGVWLLSRLIPANVLPCLQLFPQDARCLTRAIHRHLALRSICYDDVERVSEVISAAGAMIDRRLRGKDNKNGFVNVAHLLFRTLSEICYDCVTWSVQNIIWNPRKDTLIVYIKMLV